MHNSSSILLANALTSSSSSFSIESASFLFFEDLASSLLKLSLDDWLDKLYWSLSKSFEFSNDSIDCSSFGDLISCESPVLLLFS